MPFGNSPFGETSPSHGTHDDPPIPSYALGRRTSVSAESLVPTSHRAYGPSSGLETTMEEDEATPNINSGTPVFPKSEEQLARIRQAIKPNFLFRNLDDEQEADVLAAMKEVKANVGQMVIEQGAAGDFFYIVESGKLDVFIKREGQILDLEKGDRPGLGMKVAECSEGSSFGELALMHKLVHLHFSTIHLSNQPNSAPRAASIISVTPCTLWALDRVSFRTILLDVRDIPRLARNSKLMNDQHTSRKRRLYESFLSEVPILASLQPQERAKIADVLESRTYNEGEDVIRQGDAGEEFFLIESGNAVAIKTDEDGNESVVKNLGQGEYFGGKSTIITRGAARLMVSKSADTCCTELALLNRRKRAATIRAAGPDKLRVAALGEQAFTRLLGPVKDIMARSVSERYGSSTGRGSV